MTQTNAEARPVIALGTFDGLHPGHRKVLSVCAELACAFHAPAAVYTFLENPKSLFGAAPETLMTNEEKEREMRSLGIDTVLAVHFTPSLASLSPEEFLSMLLNEYRPRALVAGEDYTFGKHAAGGSGLLKELCAQNGIKCVIVPLVRDARTGEAYSSTRIREALAKGDYELARTLKNGIEADK